MNQFKTWPYGVIEWFQLFLLLYVDPQSFIYWVDLIFHKSKNFKIKFFRPILYFKHVQILLDLSEEIEYY